MTECGFHITMARQMFQGRPRSTISATTTIRYPRNAVRMAGRTIGRSRSR